MVDKEEIKIDTELVRKIVAGGIARRGANGEWSLVIFLDGDIALDDNRTLPVRREVAVKARQQGRRANPAQNWGKGGGFRSKE